MLLAADVGGTNTRLALFDAEMGGPRLRVFEKFSSRSHASLEEIVAQFLTTHPEQIEAAYVGVAGPVKQARAVVTNLPWAVDARHLAERLSLHTVGLINDIEANAWGIAALSENDFLELFVSIYGAVAGNVALHFMATGGVYLGGGIAPKIAQRLKRETFLEAYLDKGRLSPVLALIPVRVLMNDNTALLGAARWAWRWMKR